MSRDPRFAEHLAVSVEAARGRKLLGRFPQAGLTPSAMMRQIDALEHDLALPLFIRSTRALALTDAGRRLFEREQTLLDAPADTRSEVAGLDGTVAGLLRIAAVPTFGKRYILSALDFLMREHPGRGGGARPDRAARRSGRRAAGRGDPHGSTRRQLPDRDPPCR